MNAPEKELLRHAALEVLAARHPAALTLKAIGNKVRLGVDFQFGDEDLTGALALLQGLGLAREFPDELGSTRYWSSTPAGVLQVERNA
jgi:hypothetical protein